MRRQRRTKIVATLGPASCTEAAIEALFVAGADVFRVNMSHTPHEAMRGYVAAIRAVERRLDRPIAVLADLQGPKLRLGTFARGEAYAEAGALIVLDGSPAPGDAGRVGLPHPEVLAALAPGHALLIDDGKVRLTVVEAAPGRVVARVAVPGRLADRKGVSLPDTLLEGSVMTPKDRADAEATLNEGVDWIALSFVQRPDDVAELRKLARGRAAVMAKIEKPQALASIEAIIEASDGIMVARGDLGVEMPVEQVPGIQKRLTRACRRLGRPVVVATQMLESMVASPVPTRAEISDVATAVFEGADAVMLSAETAAGKHPLEAVATMDRVAQAVERDPTYREVIAAQRGAPSASGADAIAAAAREIAESLGYGAVVCWTLSGSSAARVARERPRPLVLALSPEVATARRLALTWGTHPVVSADIRDLDDMAERACATARAEGFAGPGQRIVIVAGVPFGTPGATNLLRIATLPRE